MALTPFSGSGYVGTELPRPTCVRRWAPRGELGPDRSTPFGGYMTARDAPDDSLVHVPRWTCALGVVTGLAAIASSPAVPVSKGCGLRGYAYAGLQSDRQGFGVTATLTALADPLVERGHVAAWVGVGAPGEGPRRNQRMAPDRAEQDRRQPDARLYYEIVQPWGTALCGTRQKHLCRPPHRSFRARDGPPEGRLARLGRRLVRPANRSTSRQPSAGLRRWRWPRTGTAESPPATATSTASAVSRLRGAREARGRRSADATGQVVQDAGYRILPSPDRRLRRRHRAAAGGRTDHTVNGSIGPDAKARIRQLLLRSFSAVSLKYGLVRISLAAARLENLLGSHPGKGRFLAGPSGCVAATPLFGARGRPLQAFRR